MSRLFVVAVTGDRNYWNHDAVYGVLDAVDHFQPITWLVHGDAKGADSIARAWAEKRHVPHVPYPVPKADWERFGLAAGPMRNRKMLEEERPDLLVAFPGGRGTRSCVSIAQEQKIAVLRVRRQDEQTGAGSV